MRGTFERNVFVFFSEFRVTFQVFHEKDGYFKVHALEFYLE